MSHFQVRTCGFILLKIKFSYYTSRDYSHKFEHFIYPTKLNRKIHIIHSIPITSRAIFFVKLHFYFNLKKYFPYTFLMNILLKINKLHSLKKCYIHSMHMLRKNKKDPSIATGQPFLALINI